MVLTVAPEVRDALASGRPVVALESTVFSPFGLPAPANADALERCTRAVRASGAVPAVTAVLDGKPRVGLEPGEHDRILSGGVKLGERDLPVAIAHSLDVGVTTVSASLALADRAGIRVFATGGIGGVHRGAASTGDVSADLGAIAAHPLVTVCAGAKAFLDIGRTLEHLEMLGVPVLGWRTDDFPMFWCTSSGFAVAHRVESEHEVAATLRASADLGIGRGVLLAVPIPPAAALPRAEIEAAITRATAQGRVGPDETPRVLAAIAAATDGRSVPANLALAEHNAAVAGRVAGSLATS